MELKQMSETSLAIARKIVLYVGLLTSALLFAYPHWKLSIDVKNGNPIFEQDIGRVFILSPPLVGTQVIPFPTIAGIRPVFRIHYVRQFTEVALALLFTFGLMRALRKPAGSRAAVQE